MVDAKQKSSTGQSGNIEAVTPELGTNSSLNNNLSDASLPAPSSGDVLTGDSNFTQNNISEQPTTTAENVTPPVENTTTSEQPTTTAENVTPPVENTTTSGPPKNNNATSTNVTTATVPLVGGVDILNPIANSSTDQALPAEQPITNNATTTNTTTSETTEITSDTPDQTTPPEDTLGALVSNQTDAAASAVAGVTASNSNVENNQASNIQNIINNIALSGAQSGGNSQSIAQQISKEIIANPRGQIANSIKQLANEFTQGNGDEVNIAADQIGSLIAKGNNIQQTLVQVTNNVVNNIKNIKSTVNNFDKVIIQPSFNSQKKKEITQTVDVIKNAKQEVNVPRIHIKFHSHERSLVLRMLTTNNYRYEMPFSKFNGAFTLDDNQFRVKILSGDGSIKAASMAQMFKSGKIGDRNFLDKDVKNGKVFFSLNDIKSGRYLLEVYVKLSNGVVGTFARGSVSIK
jgi:hypothetical protein